jgi:predicted transcriptional regulator
MRQASVTPSENSTALFSLPGDAAQQEPSILRGEFWTSRQRQACSLHEISDRACFKPQLPRFFIELFTRPGDVVYDPFMGRGTTPVEAALNGRVPMGNDVNPLSMLLTRPRIHIPSYSEVEERLERIWPPPSAKAELDLSMFFHPHTEAEILGLRAYLADRLESEQEDEVDAWIRLVATNRLTGHSVGFFSVYTLPPNQAVSPESQIKINQKRNQSPAYRDVRRIILKKTRALLKDVTDEMRRSIAPLARRARFFNRDAGQTPGIPAESVQLTVTSPPFLDVVAYSQDNWLRCWFNRINDQDVSRRITMARTVESWAQAMGRVFQELFRITRSGGHVAFEVGEVRRGTVKLEEIVVPLGQKAGFQCLRILINEQRFTKTANIWGVRNNEDGTNSNRIVIFKK